MFVLFSWRNIYAAFLDFFFFFSDQIYLGGLYPVNLEHYANHSKSINAHFDQHIPIIAGGNYDSMDDIPPTLPRRRFPYQEC